MSETTSYGDAFHAMVKAIREEWKEFIEAVANEVHALVREPENLRLFRESLRAFAAQWERTRRRLEQRSAGYKVQRDKDGERALQDERFRNGDIRPDGKDSWNVSTGRPNGGIYWDKDCPVGEQRGCWRRFHPAYQHIADKWFTDNEKRPGEPRAVYRPLERRRKYIVLVAIHDYGQSEAEKIGSPDIWPQAIADRVWGWIDNCWSSAETLHRRKAYIRTALADVKAELKKDADRHKTENTIEQEKKTAPESLGDNHRWCPIGLSKKEIGLALGLPDDRKIAESVNALCGSLGIVLRPANPCAKHAQTWLVALDTLRSPQWERFRDYMKAFHNHALSEHPVAPDSP